MPAPQKIIDLVERFEQNKDSYITGHYNETQLRREFVDPFFKALGWDIDNEKSYAEAYKEVIHEDAIRIGGVHKAPDYCMRVGGVRKFFVEAKKPSVHIKTDTEPAFQIRRYAWSAKLPLSILTDFEEFAIYDCRIKPSKNDGAATARIHYFTYKEYIEKWDEIASIFSHDAILKGSFDKYAEKSRQKKGTEEVDDAFLKEIEGWRELFAKNIAIRNPELSQRELNFAVQRTIDRIIFLRICEDRGVEGYKRLAAEANGAGIYGRLIKLFREADDRYNSGLFHFHDEKDQAEAPDTLSLNLKIDDDVLQKIISHLYYPDSPYEFSVLSADILGQVYEQFLGKVIRLTEGHHAKVEEKPEVRKAGGVYYTPTYIVDYIVKHTVGKLLEGKTAKEVSDLKIVDPACGSGSFLLGAYQHLLDWHLQWYTDHDPKKWKKELAQVPTGDWRLTTAERKRILLNNIFGVDIDSQAVEVTKLSLLLKVLEGETQQTIQQQLSGMRERVLPDLGKNIQCGNSLIGSDFNSGQQQGMFELDDEEKYRINVFDWESAFPQVFTRKNSGFDAVIGNPPWVSLKGKFGNEICSDKELEYLLTKFSGDTYRPNLYEFFIKKAIGLTRTGGIQSFIVPDRLGFNEQFTDFRKHLLETGKIISLVYKASFPDVTADTLIYVFSPTRPEPDHKVEIGEFGMDLVSIPQISFLLFQDYQFLSINPLIQKIYFDSKINLPLSKILCSSVGFISKTKLITEEKISTKQVPILRGRNVHRYNQSGEAYFDFKKENLAGGTQDIERLGVKEKLLVRKTGTPILCTFDETGRFIEQSLYFLYNPVNNFNLKYILGIINSSVFHYLYWNWMVTNRDATPQLKKIHLDQFPIPNIDFSIASERAKHDKIVVFVDQILVLNKKTLGSKTPHEQESLKREIEATDRQIDQLVYELYGLSKEDQEIVRKTSS